MSDCLHVGICRSFLFTLKSLQLIRESVQNVCRNTDLLQNDANPSLSRVRIYYLVTLLLPDLYLTGEGGFHGVPDT